MSRWRIQIYDEALHVTKILLFQQGAKAEMHWAGSSVEFWSVGRQVALAARISSQTLGVVNSTWHRGNISELIELSGEVNKES